MEDMKFGLKEEKHMFKGALLFLTVIVFTFIFGIMILLGVYVLMKTNCEEEPRSRPFENYKFREYDPLTDDSRSGILSLPKHIPTNEYFSYRDENGKYTMISNFDDDEYRCTGSCFCKDSRRQSSSLLGKGVIFFMTAVSTSVAYQLSQIHFQEECTSMFMEECSESKISSSVDNCENVKEGKKEGERKQYLCIGECIPNRVIPESDLGVNRFEECKNFESRSHIMGFSEDEAKITFIESDLDPTCQRLTEYEPEGVRDDSICVGGTVETNPTVGCVEDYAEEDD